MDFERYGMEMYAKTHLQEADELVYDYIVDTWEECFKDVKTFDKYIKEDVIIFNRKYFHDDIQDLLVYTDNLENLCDIMGTLDWGDFYEGYDCVYTTSANKENIRNNRLNFIGICMEYERMCTLMEKEYDFDAQEIDDILVIFEEYGIHLHNCRNTFDIKDRIEQIFGEL